MGAVSWSSMWRGGLLALGIAFAVSTQLLFQLDLYENWPLSAILLGWLDYLIDQFIVVGSMFVAVVAALFIPVRSMTGRAMCVLGAILLGALGGEIYVMLNTQPLQELPVPTVLAKVARWLVIAGLACAFFILREQAARAAAEAHQNRMQRIN